MICNNCQREIYDNTKFCPYCGMQMIAAPPDISRAAYSVASYEENSAESVAEPVQTLAEETAAAPAEDTVRFSPHMAEEADVRPYTPMGYAPPVQTPPVQTSPQAAAEEPRGGITVKRDPQTRPLSTGQFWLMEFVFMIPIIGLVVMCAWALGRGNVNRANLARAKLLMCFIVLFILLSAIVVLLALAANGLIALPAVQLIW